ncbi:MAG: ATP synthase F1 subunit gamma [Candidatus Saccharibacteria bacterium]|nr:ATP synthase F1 subunit gamma [Candidatus Saccharibacteria bacterium]
MASRQQLKQRIGSVKSTKQITKAMELVSASKMRRAQEQAMRSRDYRNIARQILARLRQLTDVKKHPLYTQRSLGTRLHIVVTSNRGLAGAYNSNVLKRLTLELQQDKEAGVVSKIIVIGKQGARFIVRFEDIEVLAVYESFPDQLTANDIRPLLDTITSQFTEAIVDAVDIIYTDYKTSITQIVTVDRLLPAAYSYEPVEPDLENAVFEPSPEAVLVAITERLIESQLSQAIMESAASEQSMRMMAMKSATDNASDLIEDLTLAYNTARQGAITQELAEITGGAEAIK